MCPLSSGEFLDYGDFLSFSGSQAHAYSKGCVLEQLFLYQLTRFDNVTQFLGFYRNVATNGEVVSEKTPKITQTLSLVSRYRINRLQPRSVHLGKVHNEFQVTGSPTRSIIQNFFVFIKKNGKISYGE